jgi:hypothetical protein
LLVLSHYRPFLTPGPMLPFRASGSLRFQYAGETETGEFLLTGDEQHAFRLQLLAPVTGSLALDVRFDPGRILALNYAETTYFQGENTPENRRRLFSLDITPPEFLLLLTGRVPAQAYAAADGTAVSPDERWMGSWPVRYRFWLDEQGLPRRWSKERYGAELFRVEYRDFMAIPDGGAPPLRMPRKIRVRSGDAGTVLILGVREFLPGARSPEPVRFVLPEGKAWRFAPLPQEKP